MGTDITLVIAIAALLLPSLLMYYVERKIRKPKATCLACYTEADSVLLVGDIRYFVHPNGYICSVDTNTLGEG